MIHTRTRTLAAGASLALLVGAVGFAPASAATSEQVAIPSDGYDIAGTLVMPDGEAAAPAVLMLHGYASSADEVGGMYARAAEALAAEGVGSLRIDFAGMGASEASTLDYDWDSQTGDAAASLDWLLAQDGVDPERVGVLGFSNGGMIGSLPRGHRRASGGIRLVVGRDLQRRRKGDVPGAQPGAVRSHRGGPAGAGPGLAPHRPTVANTSSR